MQEFTEEEQEIIRKMRKSHKTITQMAAALGRSYFDIQTYLRQHGKRNNYWTSLEVRKLNEAIAKGWGPTAIQQILPHRTIDAIVGKIDYQRQMRIKKEIAQPKRLSVPDILIEDRDRRANEYRTLDQVLMGDPPPSRSALGRPCQQ